MFRVIYIILVGFWQLLITIPKLYKIRKMDKNSLERKEEVKNVAKQFSDKVMEATGAEITVNGLENIPQDKTVLYVANHLSLFDIPLLLKYIPQQIGFVAKMQLKWIPIVRKWIPELNGEFLDRENKRKAKKTIDKEIELLNKGNSLVVFPEGTRKEKKKTCFKSGSFRPARETNVPVLPAVISGTENILKGKAKKSGIQLTFLSPRFIDPKDNINHVAKNIQEEIYEEKERHKVLVKKQ